MTERFILKSDVDALDISVVVVSPEEVSPKMALQLAHGMCGCKERFMPFMEYMASKGVLCVANDHRGHGESVRQTDDLGYMYEGGLMPWLRIWPRYQDGYIRAMPVFRFICLVTVWDRWLLVYMPNAMMNLSTD